MTEDDNIPDDSEDWTNLIDRGGLKHVNNVAYMLMAAMEIEVCQNLLRGPATENLIEVMMKNILMSCSTGLYCQPTGMRRWDRLCCPHDH